MNNNSNKTNSKLKIINICLCMHGGGEGQPNLTHPMENNIKITSFRDVVYEVCKQIPSGKFTTYKVIARTLNSSPRAVGQALKVNPYAPTVPCHRVLSSKFHIGGYCGETDLKSKKISTKLSILKDEGLFFDGDGNLEISQRDLLFTQFKHPQKLSSKASV